MSEDGTPRLALPVLQIGQANKEQVHNEALALIDMVVGAVVEEIDVDVPPADPRPGQCWIVGAAPSGAWVGNAQAIAGWTVGGWRFVAATPRLSAWCVARQVHVTFGDRWEEGVIRAHRILIDGEQVIAGRQGAVPPPVGGAVIDAEARGALTAIIAAMRAHGLLR
jgi:hypothetical protein